MKEKTGGQILVEGLRNLGIDRVFGVIGMSVMDIMDALFNEKDRIRYISCRHEQVAASMADAHGRLSGTPGVCLLHSGPGALNAVISLANAAKDCSPLIAITGAVKARVAGTNGILEADHQSVYQSICKQTYHIDTASDAGKTLLDAYQTAMSFPRGPVLIEFPEDSAAALSELPAPEQATDIPLPPAISENTVNELVTTLDKAERPLILAGAGISYSGSSGLLKQLVEGLNVPVITTSNGRGTLSEVHPLCLGRCGFGGGNIAADEALKLADVILGIGCTLSDLTTYEYTLPIQADIFVVNLDTDNEAKKIPIKQAVFGDAADFLATALKKLPQEPPKTREKWFSAFEAPKKTWADLVTAACDREKTPLSPGFVCNTLNDLLPKETIITVGSGTHVLYAIGYIPRYQPLTYLTAVNFGAMGFGFPAALAAKLCKPDHTVINITGDGDFMMTVQDLETAVREEIPVKILIINDNSYRVLYLRQKFLFEGRVLGTQHSNPDFVKLAESFGAEGIRIEKPSDVKPGLQKMLDCKKPVIVEAIVDPDDMGPTNLEAVFNMG